MIKWVTFLLLLLAVLAYGLSQMRPVPPTEATAESTPVALEQTPQAAPSPEPSSTEVLATSPPPRRTSKSPAFGLPGQRTPQASPTPGVAKSDPFSTGPAKVQQVAGTIKAVTFSSSSGGPSQTKFPPDTASIYITATPESLKNEIEVVAAYRSVLDEKAEFSPPVDSSGPPRKRVFRLVSPDGGWKAGPYQVVFRVKGGDQVLGIERFEILGADEVLTTEFPAPEYLDLVPDMGESTPASNSFLSTDKEILLRVSASELKPGTAIRTVWSVVEVDLLTAGELVAVASQPAPGPGQDAIFTLEAPPGGYHSGSYKVDIYFEQELAGSHAFFVQAPARTTSKP